MKQRLDAIEKKLLMYFPTEKCADWSDAPQEVLEAIEVLEVIAATLPPAEMYRRLAEETFGACKVVADWVSEKCTPEATL